MYSYIYYSLCKPDRINCPEYLKGPYLTHDAYAPNFVHGALSPNALQNRSTPNLLENRSSLVY